MKALSSFMAMLPVVHHFRQSSHEAHFLMFTKGRTLECWSSLPARDAPPIPRFLRHAPNRVTRCPVNGSGSPAPREGQLRRWDVLEVLPVDADLTSRSQQAVRDEDRGAKGSG